MNKARTIYKVTLEVTDEQEIEMPDGAEIIHVEAQHGAPAAWFLCDPKEPKKKYKIICKGTGHPIEDISKLGRHLGTVLLMNGHMVFHYFMGVE